MVNMKVVVVKEMMPYDLVHIYRQSRGTSIFRVEKCRFHAFMSQNIITLALSKGLVHCANVFSVVIV